MASKSAKTQFLIVDGHALLHRAWHALPPLTTKSGMVVHGAYGFITIMLGAIKKFGPEYMAVTFDLPGGTFRNDLYDEYKATREKKPDELYAQKDVVMDVLAAMNIPVFAVEGFEADDVIGTLSKMANAQDPHVESVIVTGDLDTLQLVDARTKVFTLRKGMSDTVVYDDAVVKERYGLKPSQLIDYKALRGDPSDNIPGVKGVGEKTGSELISEFGSVVKLYESLDKNDKKAQALKPAVREKLLADRANAFLALDLCRIRRDVPLDFVLHDCAFVPSTREQLTPVFTSLEFIKLLNQFPSESGATAAAVTAAGDAAAVAKMKASRKIPSLFDAAREVAAEKADPVATSGFEEVGAAALTKALAGVKEVAFRSDAEGRLGLTTADGSFLVAIAACVKPLAALFADDSVRKICHDLKHERRVLSAAGVLPDVVSGTNFFDLMLASYLLHSGERRHTLSAILAYERSVPSDDEPTLVTALPHFLPLAASFRTELKEQKLLGLMDDMETPLAGVLARMEQTGIAIDAPYFKKLSKELATEVASLTAEIHKLGGREFNINSPAQMKQVLFDEIGISSEGMKKTAKGGTLSTAASELEKLAGSHPIIEKILRYRELTKLLSTYVDAIPAAASPEDGRVHAEFNQTVAATGRLSSANPNMQNIPATDTDYGKRVRSGFVATKGYVLVAADYSQIELRIAAHIANEKTMIASFNAGEDIHWRTAVEMFGEEKAASMRRIAKVINFGIIYGMGANALAVTAGITFGEAKVYIAQYFALHQGIARYMEETKQKIARDGFVETLFGRKRFFRNVKFMNPRERAEAERAAINMPIQGANADIIKLAMVKLDEFVTKKYGTGPDAEVRMLVQVHDELVFEARKEVADAFAIELPPFMTDVVKLKVPVVVNVSTGQRWGEMKKIL